ncbi:hypothetical protein [Necropsobacter massiliensis]|uniref:hypothetical protein n=1 Tax=Necropsobacter massiliensis TaxID=1400001 RepID=UPI0009E1B562|nr:hypothetical protein [Necropsobacter massiliensis]
MSGRKLPILLALSVGTLVQDLHIQFHHVRPWLLLDDEALKSPSTLMPQKRNPVALNRTRLLASEVIGDAVKAIMAAHNVNSGLTDYKRENAAETLERACRMLNELNAVLGGIRVDKAAALEQVNADYSVTSELAGALQRKLGIPFKVTHEFSSRLVNYGREHRLKPAELPFTEAVRIFKLVSQEMNGVESELGLTEEAFFSLLDPNRMINSYVGVGGSHPIEVERLTKRAQEGVQEDDAWHLNLQRNLEESAARLDELFSEVVKGEEESSFWL